MYINTKSFYILTMELVEKAIQADMHVMLNYHPCLNNEQQPKQPFFGLTLKYKNKYTTFTLSSIASSDELWKEYKQAFDFIEKHTKNK